jgi:hypothetical protein
MKSNKGQPDNDLGQEHEFACKFNYRNTHQRNLEKKQKRKHKSDNEEDEKVEEQIVDNHVKKQRSKKSQSHIYGITYLMPSTLIQNLNAHLLHPSFQLMSLSLTTKVCLHLEE